jgi:hypothetical protein
MEYLNRFKEFPSLGKIEDTFIEHVEIIFEEAFPLGTFLGEECRLFLISDDVVARAIDFVSGQIQQMKLLMDDTNAPSWGGSPGRSLIVLPVNGVDFNSNNDKQKKRKKTGMCCSLIALFIVMMLVVVVVVYTSTAKLHRVAVSILLFPSVCFTSTQLHVVPFIHNMHAADVHCVLAHLVECDLLECVRRGVKTPRRSTTVYVKRLPLIGVDDEIDQDQIGIFAERFSEFNEQHTELTVEEYIRKSSVADLDALGIVTDELMMVLSMPEYCLIDLSLLNQLGKKSQMLIHLL